MVEFAVAGMVLFFLIAVFVDFGLTIHQQLLLNHVTNQTVRNAAVAFNTRPSCSAISDYFTDTATKELNATLGPRANGGPTWHIEWLSSDCPAGQQSFAGVGGSDAVLRVTGGMEAHCYLLCKMFPQGWQISSTSEAIIERRASPCLDFCPNV